MKLSKVLLTGTVGLLSLGLAACGGGSGEGGGGGSQTVFKLAFNQTEEHPQYKAAVSLSEKLEEATDGRYSIKVYPNEQLGTQSDVVQNLSDGTVEMMYIGGPVMEGFNSDFIVYNLPYMFDTYEAQQQIFNDDELNADLFASLEDSKNIDVLTALYAGVRNIYNSKQPIQTPEDLQGLKIRVQQSDSQVQMIEAMGGIASPMGQGDVYSALQTGVLDGAENNTTVFHQLKHDEVSKYYSYTKHLMIPDYLLINSDVLAGMDDADREAFLALIPETREEANSGFLEFEDESRTEAEGIGAEFNEDVDTAAFKELTQPVVDAAVAENDVRKTLYDAIQAANEANPA
ncbi:TRAP transporter substrate-binding protein [Propionimicrobium sp. PCR01-08-3]|uniref:TRAP transporter substrate-binding protein n=1 Tax=Propionimicrobium sp. PCR01-08-3 TaxID=3052086 RepID=UPI00255D1292|nr:TRAP transporter substrate-binding protein [Propionimicrobium sp. PCR01-08-3]WIY82549.1 TRAP transporter substrate-binding protein [Propionimicrobium sp. PCR01-08-3]